MIANPQKIGSLITSQLQATDVLYIFTECGSGCLKCIVSASGTSTTCVTCKDRFVKNGEKCECKCGKILMYWTNDSFIVYFLDYDVLILSAFVCSMSWQLQTVHLWHG